MFNFTRDACCRSAQFAAPHSAVPVLSVPVLLVPVLFEIM
jgi:hypothetical protein